MGEWGARVGRVGARVEAWETTAAEGRRSVRWLDTVELGPSTRLESPGKTRPILRGGSPSPTRSVESGQVDCPQSSTSHPFHESGIPTPFADATLTHLVSPGGEDQARKLSLPSARRPTPFVWRQRASDAGFLPGYVSSPAPWTQHTSGNLEWQLSRSPRSRQPPTEQHQHSSWRSLKYCGATQ